MKWLRKLFASREKTTQVTSITNIDKLQKNFYLIEVYQDPYESNTLYDLTINLATISTINGTVLMGAHIKNKSTGKIELTNGQVYFTKLQHEELLDLFGINNDDDEDEEDGGILPDNEPPGITKEQFEEMIK